MTTPDVPLRFEFAVEVPGTPEQVWHAIATGDGISSWMLPTEMEEREGGTVVFHMGPEVSSKGTVTAWDPPRRLAYEEPDWAALAGREGVEVTPIATEFLVEARSGGTCVVRVVSSAFGTGADWEREFFDDMGKGWTPMFDHLRLYLTYFPGQRATNMEAGAEAEGTPATVASAMRGALGIEEVGQQVEVRGATGLVERIAEESIVLRLTRPVPGLLAFYAFGTGEGKVNAAVGGYFFSDDAPGYVEREQPGWKAWLEQLATPAANR